MNTRLLRKRHGPPPHPILRVTRIIFGALVLLLGVIMIFTPGPAVLAIPFGLWLLSADIRLARRFLLKARLAARRTRRKYKAFRERQDQKERDRDASRPPP